MTLKGKLVSSDEFEAIVFFNNCNMIVHLLSTLHIFKIVTHSLSL